jgi:hypothetical protein
MKIASSASNAARSDRLRQRRTERSQENIRRVTTQARAPATPARRPVILRSGAIHSPALQRPRTRVRRKIFFNLSASGVELGLPSIPVVHPSWRMLSGFLTFALTILLVFLSSSSMFQVNQVTIEGLQRLSVEKVQTIMDIADTMVFAIDPAQVIQRVHDNFPELADIQLIVGLPNSVTLTVRERQPVIAWKYGETTLWIDPEGAVFLPSDETSQLVTVLSEEAPPMILFGTQPTSGQLPPSVLLDSNSTFNPDFRRVDPDILASISTLYVQMPADATLAYNAQEGFGWQDSRGWKVFFGKKFENLELKLAAYAQIVTQLERLGIQPVMISIARLEAPFYRVEQ